ncbi:MULTISPECIES: ParB/RepB/Spo0J family partition protein [Bacillota]|jgi:ParB family chromosome partitioning protein|uniref:ParB/RepB/Spo0J family partition protein n=1 Tax=[Eubacterium] hominis TaxID=2764325 RepID=A0A7G9GTR6_9FIRM|nr:MULTISPECIES: ParB/RepB/Spo0J family partition protein [Bacillota]MCR0451621.1 ParB/RepB/Spo0J family partition protein [[Clostridium] innocuum]QNM14198.1 ParB/RepB/Spo0J family partition protein [[Eubacterium] hominis]MCR0474016.1 ParB/RepB/Spo0J family partition protein [[Clostridium] innocuum]RGB54067.1 ParB/RepB/Spo0J family partition protein [Absiella sp. AM22-9]RGB61134.1 ParB/RepB/Spo0J family partition protein [Absiella sp. AM10-20]
MPRERLNGIEIPSLDDDVFESDDKKALDQAEKVIEIKLNKIVDFPNHPFQVREDEEMLELIDSVGRNGVLMPAIVRPTEDGKYQMIAGHRRKYASEKNDKATMPALVRSLTDDEATIIMVDTNLRQRQNILPSEKAFSYKMMLDALTHQGKRNDLTSVPLGPKLRANEELAQKVKESQTQIKRYIRLTYLSKELLEYVDNNKIALRPAVEISYLTQEEQQSLLYYIQLNDCTPSHDQTIRMRKMHDDDTLTDDTIRNIMEEEKPNQVEKFRITKNRIEKFFKPSTSAKEMENEIIKALEYYQRYKNRNKNRGER